MDRSSALMRNMDNKITCDISTTLPVSFLFFFFGMDFNGYIECIVLVSYSRNIQADSELNDFILLLLLSVLFGLY